MITRQRTLLRLLDLEAGKISKLRLFKLAFLLSERAKEAPQSALYQFLPYQFGPYSFTLNHELKALERDGWLRVLDNEICSTRSLKSESESRELQKPEPELKSQSKSLELQETGIKWCLKP